MRIESLGRFNPLCESKLVITNRESLQRVVTGWSCKPCVTPEETECGCCDNNFKFNLPSMTHVFTSGMTTYTVVTGAVNNVMMRYYNDAGQPGTADLCGWASENLDTDEITPTTIDGLGLPGYDIRGYANGVVEWNRVGTTPYSMTYANDILAYPPTYFGMNTVLTVMIEARSVSTGVLVAFATYLKTPDKMICGSNEFTFDSNGGSSGFVSTTTWPDKIIISGSPWDNQWRSSHYSYQCHH